MQNSYSSVLIVFLIAYLLCTYSIYHVPSWYLVCPWYETLTYPHTHNTTLNNPWISLVLIPLVCIIQVLCTIPVQHWYVQSREAWWMKKDMTEGWCKRDEKGWAQGGIQNAGIWRRIMNGYIENPWTKVSFYSSVNVPWTSLLCSFAAGKHDEWKMTWKRDDDAIGMKNGCQRGS
jgi:hypothetical protein